MAVIIHTSDEIPRRSVVKAFKNAAKLITIAIETHARYMENGIRTKNISLLFMFSLDKRIYAISRATHIINNRTKLYSM